MPTGPVQVTSQPHELAQSTLWHELVPLQVTWHGPSPHWMFLQLFEPPHWIVHCVASVQTTPFLHEFGALQPMVQL